MNYLLIVNVFLLALSYNSKHLENRAKSEYIVIEKEDTTKVQHSGIIFEDDFEVATIDEVLTKWSDTKNSKGMSLSTDVPKGSLGKQSLMMTYNPGVDEGGHLFKSFADGYDKMFVRFYVKFLTRKSRLHHFVRMGGYNPMTNYPQGLAGLKPNGEDFFITGVEAPDNGVWNWGFYTYWMHMKGSPGAYWGNVFLPENAKSIPTEKWICVEFMVKMNQSMDDSDGEQAFWIDGKKIAHFGKGFPKVNQSGGYIRENQSGTDFGGLQWRTNDQLKINYIWLNYYMTHGVAGNIEKILFDDFVVSADYIGPLENIE